MFSGSVGRRSLEGDQDLPKLSKPICAPEGDLRGRRLKRRASEQEPSVEGPIPTIDQIKKKLIRDTSFSTIEEEKPVPMEIEKMPPRDIAKELEEANNNKNLVDEYSDLSEKIINILSKKEKKYSKKPDYRKSEEFRDLNTLKFTLESKLKTLVTKKNSLENFLSQHGQLLTLAEHMKFSKFKKLLLQETLLFLKETVDTCDLEDDFFKKRSKVTSEELESSFHSLEKIYGPIEKDDIESNYFLDQLRKRPIYHDLNQFDRPLLELSDKEQEDFIHFKNNVPLEIQNYLNKKDTRGVNTDHQKIYGDYDQSLYSKHCKLLSLYTVFALLKNTPTTVELIKKIGSGRRIFAKLTKTPDADIFGRPRTYYPKPIEYMGSVSTALHPTYDVYHKRAQKIAPGYSYQIQSRCDFLETKLAFTGIVNLTGMDDTAWNKLGELLEDAKKPSLSDDETVRKNEIGEKIGRFHWYFAQFTPFSRGSAAVAEIITDALWLYHGYIRDKPDMFEDKINRKSADLEALVPEEGPCVKKVPDPEGGPGATKDEYPEDRYQKKYTTFWTEYTPITDKDWASKALPLEL